jgi:predicted nucleotidyltransferase
MNSFENIRIEEVALLLRPCPFIVAAYVFGSTVRGQAGPLSDLDIAILVNEQAPPTVDLLRVELLLSYELQKHLNVPEVDLVTLNHQRLTMQHAILRTGWLIYDADPPYRIRFTQQVIQAYLDFQPTLEFIGRFHTKGRLRRCDIL